MARSSACACPMAAPSRSRRRWSRATMSRTALAAIAVGYLRASLRSSHGAGAQDVSRRAGAAWSASRRASRITVVVDYAHTADSLEKVLRVLRPLTRGRLIVVFGSAGDRDRVKRPVMGAVAARQADFAVITDEDPREEDAMSILREIAAGAEAAGASRGRAVCLYRRAARGLSRRAFAHGADG